MVKYYFLFRVLRWKKNLQDRRMPKSVTGSGTNSSGNSYTSYSGGGYSYSNPSGGADKSGSSYYSGSGNGGFYNDSAKSSYTSASGSGGWTKTK
jgi:hypothetical protein